MDFKASFGLELGVVFNRSKGNFLHLEILKVSNKSHYARSRSRLARDFFFRRLAWF